MNRSLFFNLFYRVALGLALFAGVVAYGPRLRGLIACAVGLILSAAVTWWIVHSLRAAISPLEQSAMKILAPALDTLEPVDNAQRPAYRDFDKLAHAVAAASSDVQETLRASSESRHDLEALLDSMQDAVVAVDSAGRILWTNQRMQRLMPSASYNGSAGSPVRVGHALVQTIRDPDVLQVVQSTLDNKTAFYRRATSVLPGSIFEVNASPMPGGGAVAVLHDITRIEQVERTQKDFVANVSHELRTPLTSITGYVETLLDHEESLSENARSFLSTILKNALRMNRLTEDLLVMARVESAEQALSPTPIRADTLVRDAVLSMSGLIQENEAVLEVGELTRRQVFADHDAILQVLGNLIENAIKYGQARNATHSRVIVSAREIAAPFELVEFSVRDFGQGIASEHLTRIFERFYRVDKARSRESGGTGLGLAIAHHTVQMQGGTIRAESDLNAGSNFIFTLPVAQYPIADEES
ncbi:sensor histidine kinase [Granulicella sibirica]|uniref:histidine kinase n=1 Tax=Granulicella sibirica TaxID=2479048 RepID=A0A4V1L5T1_9BACT|nr:ATP-binding protein [Granulicella sibirica]RXH56844.1 Phosphate regulon sensor protein PhoR (SphS) [Granulicella sibirica]